MGSQSIQGTATDRLKAERPYCYYRVPTVVISSIIETAVLLLLGALIAWQFPKPSWADFLVKWFRFLWKLAADYFKKGPPPATEEKKE